MPSRRSGSCGVYAHAVERGGELGGAAASAEALSARREALCERRRRVEAHAMQRRQGGGQLRRVARVQLRAKRRRESVQRSWARCIIQRHQAVAQLRQVCGTVVAARCARRQPSASRGKRHRTRELAHRSALASASARDTHAVTNGAPGSCPSLARAHTRLDSACGDVASGRSTCARATSGDSSAGSGWRHSTASDHKPLDSAWVRGARDARVSRQGTMLRAQR